MGGHMREVVDYDELVEKIKEVGNRLSKLPSSTPEILSLLDEVELLFSKVGQAPPKEVQEALSVPMNHLIADELFRHSETSVKIMVASCLNEVTRISAPRQPYEDDMMKEIFELIVSSFESLSCEPGRCYTKAVLILQNIARLRSCVLMLDLDCDHLVTKMFELFLKDSCSKHPTSVFLAMEKIMSFMIKESDSVSVELLKVLLASIRKENQNVSHASWELGARVIEVCAEKLKPYIMETVMSMDCCLEDYAPILSSICKTDPDPVKNVSSGSPKVLANNKPSAHESRSAEFVQCLKAPQAALLGDRRKKKNGSPQLKDVALKKDEAADFEHDQAYQATPLDDRSTNKGRIAKKDVFGGSRSKLLKQQKSFSAGSGNKSSTAQSRKDRIQSNDVSRNQRKQASSDDDVFETPHGRKNYKDDLVGCKIKVWWPLDKKYYEGTITSFIASTKKHRVDYDDGDEEVLNLRKERWEFLGDEAPTDIALLALADKHSSQPPSNMPQQEASTDGEKEMTKMHSDRKVVIPCSGAKSDAGGNGAVETAKKSVIPEASRETKRPRLSDGQIC